MIGDFREYALGKAVRSLTEKYPQEIETIDESWQNVELTDDEFEECNIVPGEDGKDFVREEWRNKRQMEPWAELQVQFLR